MPSLASFLRPLAAAGVILCATLAAPTARAEMSAAQRADVEQVIKSYLMAHPEVLQDALTELDQRQKAQQAAASAQAVESHAQTVFDSQNQTVLGNPNGKVTLVEFFDYNCPHCRNVLADMGKLMKANPDLRYVLKDFPILTPQSVEAARVAIALRDQFQGDKFWEFHKKLMEERGLVGEPEALSAARAMGANMKELAQDMKGPQIAASLREVGQIADDIHADGTPTFVLGDSVFEGEMTFDQLNSLIGNVRKCGKTACA